MADSVSQPPRSADVLNLEPFRFSNNLPPEARDKLKEIFAHWSEAATEEALVLQLIAEAPDSLGMRIVAYRFYFHRRRPAEAAERALACIEWLARSLGLPEDWRQVKPYMADFSRWHSYTRLWLQSLLAYAYNMARLGNQEESLAALDKVEELDVEGKLDVAHLREAIVHPYEDAGMVFPKESRVQDAFD